MSIASGEIGSYTQFAEIAGTQGRRGIATAIGTNNFAVLTPCHRLIRESGEISDYRWGWGEKNALLASEAAQASR
ncbi:MAG: MGMT family protein [Sulfuriferula sp.]